MKNIRGILLALFALGLVFSISGALIFGCLLLIDFMLQVIQEKRSDFYQTPPLTIPLIIYFVWGCIVSLFSHSMDFLSILCFQTSIFLVYIFSVRLKKNEMETFLTWFAYASLVGALWGLFQILCGGNYYGESGYSYRFQIFSFVPKHLLQYISTMSGRPLGTRSHPLTYAETLLPGYFVFLGITHSHWSRGFSKNIKNIFSLVFFLVVLWYSQSRGVWLAVTAGTFVFGLMQGRRIALITISTIFVVNGIFFVCSPSLRGRALSTFSKSQGGDGDQLSKRIRFELWSQSLQAIRKRPIAGVGIKGAKFEVLDAHTGRIIPWSESHNLFLQCGVDQGVTGLVFFLLLMAALFQTILKLPSNWRGESMGLLAAFLVAGLTESWLGDREIAMLFWTFIGCVLFAYKNKTALNEKA